MRLWTSPAAVDIQMSKLVYIWMSTLVDFWLSKPVYTKKDEGDNTKTKNMGRPVKQLAQTPTTRP